MKVLVVVAQESEKAPMQRLLRAAGIQAHVTALFPEAKSKPSMKTLREIKTTGLDKFVSESAYDVIIAAGDNAARAVLNQSAVNITKLRGRDLEYKIAAAKEK